jgi:thiamine-phosphate pyrophosphorylase
MTPAPEKIAGLYAIADTSLLRGQALIDATAAALRGGARVIQYRDKTGDAQRQDEAAQLLATCNKYGALLIINDDVALTALIGAHGVHIGREDEAVEAARAALGPRAIIGVSAYNQVARAQRLAQAGADYVAFGSFFASRTKPEAIAADIGVLTQAQRALRIPVVAIGGITPENGAALITAGADALAVVSGVFAQPDPEQAARQYTALFTRPDSNL